MNDKELRLALLLLRDEEYADISEDEDFKKSYLVIKEIANQFTEGLRPEDLAKIMMLCFMQFKMDGEAMQEVLDTIEKYANTASVIQERNDVKTPTLLH